MEEGCGFLKCEEVRGYTVFTRQCARYPLKFVTPKPDRSFIQQRQTEERADGESRQKLKPSAAASWVYIVTFGGGLVAGDVIDVKMDVGKNCNVVVSTQASTKVFKVKEGTTAPAPTLSAGAQQLLSASIDKEALLVVAPDPVTCFKDAIYKQKQTFRLANESSSLVLLDWYTSGRVANGERWAFTSYESINEVYFGDMEAPLVRDATKLTEGDFVSISEKMGDYNAVASLIVLGPRVQLLSAHLLSIRTPPYPTSTRAPKDCVWSVSSVPLPGCNDNQAVVLRATARSVNDLRDFIHPLLLLLTDVLQGDPWKGKQ